VKLVQINWNPSDRQLRQFGIVSLVAFPLLAWLWKASLAVVVGFGLAGAGLALLGLTFPRALKPIFLGLMLVSLPIGLVVGEAAMLVIYYGVFLPIGLVFRILGRDSLEMRFDRQAVTYWRPKPQPRGPASYYRQS